MYRKYSSLVSVTLLLAVGFMLLATSVSCNEDTASALEVEPLPATGSFLVTGTINREVSGEASFQIEAMNGSTSLEILIIDDFIDEFQLDLFLVYQGSGTLPNAGTYSIGGDPDDENIFRAYLNFFGGGFGDGVLFSTDNVEDAGTLTISQSTTERISGTFQFEARTLDLPGDDPAYITIQDGEFSAIAD